jgi:addiction module RelE/StbE family toxin
VVHVVWSDSAVTDLESIVEYIAQDSEHYAAAFAEKVLKAVEKLGTFPRIGRVVPEYDREDLRELIFQNYRIIYKVEPERVAIAAIVRAGRDLIRWYPPQTWDVV